MRLASTVLMPAFAFVLLASPQANAEATRDISKTPSGVYQMDPAHTSVTFKVNHLGFSRYTGRFNTVEGTLDFNTTNPERSSLDVTVYPNSVDTNSAKLEEELRGDKWLNVIKYPRATFHATKIERTSPTTGKVTGDFTMLGVTHTVVLDTALIGTGEHFMTKKPVLGFSATATIKRADYGFTNMIPFIGDEVTLQIEAEFDKTE